MEYNEAAAKMRKTLKSSPVYAHLAPFRGNLFGFKCGPIQRCLSKSIWAVFLCIRGGNWVAAGVPRPPKE
jgi:hypothetical protein